MPLASGFAGCVRFRMNGFDKGGSITLILFSFPYFVSFTTSSLAILTSSPSSSLLLISDSFKSCSNIRLGCIDDDDYDDDDEA